MTQAETVARSVADPLAATRTLTSVTQVLATFRDSEHARRTVSYRRVVERRQGLVSLGIKT